MADWRVAREEMVARVRGRGGIGEEVAGALRAVPRHLFLPGVPPETAYRDEAIVTRRDAEGRPVSSSSQPTIMAVMLEQLGMEPGHRVLEVGAGTGYNAALLAYLAGPGGRVTSVDIDPDLVGRARGHLAEAGFTGVEVVCGDGAEGFAPGAPYDRVIATVGVWDLFPAWLEQLAPGGRIVAPVDLNGVQRSVALERADGRWTSRSAVACGFMRLRGPFAGPEVLRPLDPESELMISLPRARKTGDVLAALGGPAAELPSGVDAGPAALADGFGLWLAAHEPRWCLLSESRPRWLTAGAAGGPGFTMVMGIVEDGGLCLLHPREAPAPPVVRAFGSGGAVLAADLLAHLRAWDAAGRPSTPGLRVDVHPGNGHPGSDGNLGDGVQAGNGMQAGDGVLSGGDGRPPGVGARSRAGDDDGSGTAPGDGLVIRKRHTTFVLSWPAARGRT
ncbi:methyltransferase, FxLD system [Streptosporangium sp. NPDC048047]|uniref:methyltransferase, FxLD system n=1 Tax=Streptosporangium sp. NPDC048047 TaxID=3155748 RepID=UPI00341A6B9B